MGPQGKGHLCSLESCHQGWGGDSEAEKALASIHMCVYMYTYACSYICTQLLLCLYNSKVTACLGHHLMVWGRALDCKMEKTTKGG